MKKIFIVKIFLLFFVNFCFGQEGYPEGLEITPENREGVIWIEGRIEEVVSVFSNYMKYYVGKTKVNIYGKVYPMKIEKKGTRLNSYKHLDLFRLKYVNVYVYDYNFNKGWMRYKVRIGGGESVFSRFFRKKKNYLIIISGYMNYFRWRLDWNDNFDEEEVKWKEYRKFIEGMVKYFKEKNIIVKRVRFYDSFQDPYKKEMEYHNPQTHLYNNMPITDEVIEYWKKTGEKISKKEFEDWMKRGIKVGYKTYNLDLSPEEMERLKEIIVE
ncbi:MAG: hypothetical protein WHS77_08965 [Brevinematales bacterium]